MFLEIETTRNGSKTFGSLEEIQWILNPGYFEKLGGLEKYSKN